MVLCYNDDRSGITCVIPEGQVIVWVVFLYDVLYIFSYMCYERKYRRWMVWLAEKNSSDGLRFVQRGLLTNKQIKGQAENHSDRKRFNQRRWTWTGDFKCRKVKTGFYRNRSMQTGSSGTLIGWKSGQTTFVPLWDWMEGAWLYGLRDAGRPTDRKIKGQAERQTYWQAENHSDRQRFIQRCRLTDN